MKILYVTPDLPYPPHQGRAIRTFHLMRAAGREHELHLLSFARPAAEVGPLAELCQRIERVPTPRRHPLRRALQLLGPQPDLAGRLPSAELARRLAELLREEAFDVVQLEGLEVAPYALGRDAELPAHLVYDAHNAEHRLQERLAAASGGLLPALYSRLQAAKLRAFEARLLGRARLTLACSAEDAGALSRLEPSARIAVVPNGVDVRYFRPDGPEADPQGLVFTGTMSFRPNVDAVLWFCRRVWPELRRVRPALHFTIVGREPTPAVRALAELPGVMVTGTVPDVRPHVRRARIYVVPMRVGSGTRLKVLEALAMGKPVVSTPMGVEGLSLGEEEGVILAADEEALIREIGRLLDDPARCRELGRRGRQAVAARYSWEAVTEPVPGLYAAG